MNIGKCTNVNITHPWIRAVKVRQPWHCHCVPLTHRLVCYFSCSPDQATMMGKVPSFSPSSTVSSALPGYVALCLTLQVHRLASAQFTVTGPDHPITASLGGEAVLSCHLSPRMSAENMEVRWFRSKYSAVVHLYHDGQDQYGEQMLEYGGRTELLKDDITNGRVFLRIHDIRPSDDGQYSCYFESSVSYEEALLELQVAEILRSEMESEKETLQSEMEREKETLQSEMKRQKGQCLGPMGCTEDFMSSQLSELNSIESHIYCQCSHCLTPLAQF
ncbi:Calpain-9 [Platysternon megacephalum]|uniref:Calpain-9 n=1 Tax=Platysternon megacephalum TaxID=55544 RepID=A0A4D9DHS4_9SAUR|nr:Calpain-9 [Platysternon megacephalum]